MPPPRHYGLLAACSLFAGMLAWQALRPDPGRADSDSPQHGRLEPAARVAAEAGINEAREGSRPLGRTETEGGARSLTHPRPIPADLAAGLAWATAPQTARPAPQARQTLPLADDFIDKILSADGRSVEIATPDGGRVNGQVGKLRRDARGVQFVDGRVTGPQAGRFMFQRQTVPGKAGSMVGFIHYDRGVEAWQVRPTGPAGAPELASAHVDEIMCRSLVVPPAEAIPQTHPTDLPVPPEEHGIVQLQSLPGATAVVYLDFDGETREFDSWGYVEAAPSGASNSQIFEVWKGVSEDFLPFAINVTTVRSVYEQAPQGSRMQVIITPTDTVYPGAGGVAYTGSFNWSGEIVCWSFRHSGKIAAEVISHEVGHTLGLGHDGRVADGASPAETYYSGHEGWAPIMGVGYYRALTQWSKGEYARADNPQDDLDIITSANNNVTWRQDDHGASFPEASWLDLEISGTAAAEGVIETRADEDAFRFATVGGNLDIEVRNADFNPNLDLKIELLNATGSLVAAADPTDRAWADLSGILLPAGEYFLRISGVGKGDPATCYSDYGSLGAYTIEGTISGGVHAERFSIPEHAAVGSVVGSVPPRDNHGAGIPTYALVGGNAGATFAIDPASGLVTVADPALLDFETLAPHWDRPARFELFVRISDSLEVAEELLRVVIAVTDVNETPDFPAPPTLHVVEHLPFGTTLTRLQASDPDRYDHVTWAIIAGNDGGAFAIDPDTGVLRVSGPLDYETLPAYTLTIRASDQGQPVNQVDRTLLVEISDLPENLAPGGVIRTFFRQLGEVPLTENPRFPQHPHSEERLPDMDSGLSRGDDYGSTLRGLLIVPETGYYTFWLSCDDSGELLLSSDADPANAASLLTQNTRTNPGDWTSSPGRQPALVHLTQGSIHYIEARHKETTQGDHIQVAWQPPSAGQPEIIPGRWLAPWQQDYAPWAEEATLVVREHAETGQIIGRVRFTEPDLGQTLASHAITAGNEAGIFAIDSDTGVISLAHPGGLTAGARYELTVTATDTGTSPATGETLVTIDALALNESLHVWWALDETSGSRAHDQSGNARHGDRIGSSLWTVRDAANGALELNGIDGGVEHGWGGGLEGETSFTAAAWVRLPANHSAEGILIQQRGSGESGEDGSFVVKIQADGRVAFSVAGMDRDGANPGNQFQLVSGTAIADGQWHHVACVRDGENGRIFINGSLSASGSGIVRRLDSSHPLAVGCDAPDQTSFLRATVDDIRIYADALAAPQIQKVAGTPKVAITSPADSPAAIGPEVGLWLDASASDPDGPSPTLAWSMVNGPGTVTFGNPSSAGTTVRFSDPGSYRLRVTASDGGSFASDDVVVEVGGSASSAFGVAEYGNASFGSFYQDQPGRFILSGQSGGMQAGATQDAFHFLGQSFTGDFDVVARVSSMGGLFGAPFGRAGLILRAGTSGAVDEPASFVGYDPDGTRWWIRRTSAGAANVASSFTNNALPGWCRISRSGGIVFLMLSSDGQDWSQVSAFLNYDEVRVGLCWTPDNLLEYGSAVFDQVSGFSLGTIGPAVWAGNDAEGEAGLPVSLAGTAADDGLPSPLTLSWSLAGGPGTATFANPAAAETTVTFPTPGVYTLRLTADDGAVRTFDDLEVTVLPGENPPTPFESWQQAKFTTQAADPQIAGPLADPDGDTLCNLLEYALATEPLEPSPSPLVTSYADISGSRFLRLTIPRNPAATDLVFTVETTSDLSDPESWTTTHTLIEQDDPASLVVRDTLGGPLRFIRLRVERP